MRDIRSILFIPKELKEQFFDVSLHKNHVVLILLGIAGIFIQGFNLIRVLVLSNSKLTTLNNRIYFAFYLFLFIISLLYLITQIWFKKRKKLCYYIDNACITIFMLWNAGITIYDTYSAGSMKVSVFIISLMVFSALFIHKLYFMISNMLVSYFLLIISTSNFQTAGSAINLTIAVVLSGVMIVNRFYSTIADLKQKQNIADISKILKDEEDRLRFTCEQYDVLLKYSNDILFVWDLKIDSIKFSDSWHDILGLPSNIQNFASWIEQNNDSQEIGEKQKNIVSQLRKSLKEGKTHSEEELIIKSISGDEIWYRMRVFNQFDKSGFAVYGIGILMDITPQKEIILELENEIKKDHVTGILNRTAVEMNINKYLKAGNKQGVLLLIDLDDFKRINDEFGHPCGDYVLRECAYILKEIFGSDSDIGRIGGDEFIVFVKYISNEFLYKKCDLINLRFKDIHWKGTKLNVGCSIGAASVTDDIGEYAKLYYQADDAMYVAKKSGKGHFYVYSEHGE